MEVIKVEENFKINKKSDAFYNNRFAAVENIECFCYDNFIFRKSKGLLFIPPTHISSDYKNWIAILDLKTCIECKNSHGKIYLIEEILDIEPPLHERCRCKIEEMQATFILTMA